MANTKITSNVISDDIALGGNPTTTTQSAGNDTTRIATTAFVKAAIDATIDSAPGALDTLNELAAAIGDDANFSTTITNSIATKLPLAGGTMTGDLDINANLQVGDGNNINMDASSNGQVEITGSGYTGAIALDGTAMHIYHNSSSRSLILGTNETERLTIDGTGKVGIGTTSPNAAEFSATPNGVLEVEGTKPVVYLSETDTTDAHAWLGVSSGVTYLGSTGLGLQIRTGTDSASTRVTVDTSGNVGIGTTSPAQLLHVSGGSGASTSVQFGEAYDTSLYIKATNTASAMLRFQNASDTVKYSIGYRNDNNVGPFRIRAAATLDSGGHKWDFDAAGALHVIPNNVAALVNITASGSGNDATITMGTALNARGFYVDDSAVNRMKFYTGYGKGVANREIIMNNDGDLAIGATRKFYLDGEGDTYITEYAGNEIGFYTGGGQRVKISGGHLYSNGNVYAGNSSTGAVYTLNSQTTHGTWGVGALNSSYVHHTTDRGIYYWNTSCQASGGFSTYSDEKLKKEITTITGALDDVAKMNGVTFKWKDAANRGGNSTGKQFGVIAQNMLEVDSELPTLNVDPIETQENIDDDSKDTDYYSMDYSRLTPYFIEAIKELKTKLEAAEARIATLEK